MVRSLSNLASAVAQHDAVAAARHADEAMEHAQRAGLLVAQSNAVVNLALGRWPLGEWDVVENCVASDWLQSQDRAVVAGVAALALSARGRDPAEMVAAIPDLEETRFYLDLARAVAQAHVADPAAVASVTSAVEGAYQVSGIYEDFPLIYGAAVQIAQQFHDETLLDRLRVIVDDDGSTPPEGLAGHRALLSAVDAERVGDPDAVAEAAFAEAGRHYRTWGSPVFVAVADAAYGLWLQERGRITDAEPLLHAAREQYVALGATGWLEALELRRHGQRAVT